MEKENFIETGRSSFFGGYLYDLIAPEGHLLRKLRQVIPLIAGAIAGGFNIVGQVIGGIAALTIAPQVLERYGFRAVNLVRDTSYWAAGLGTDLCFGLAGIGLSALVGWVAGYFGTPSRLGNPPTRQ